MRRTLVWSILVLLWAVVLVLVGGRFLALLLNANRASELVSRLLRHSDLWVQPFFGVFGLANQAVAETSGVFEPASLLAFGVYLVVGLLIQRLLTGLLFRPRR